MGYVPLARKYRPMAFADLIGQPHVTATLTRAIESGRIGQAYLFTGQRGVGKTSAARILAKSLNCAKGPTATPCHECPSCVAITQGTSLDVIEIDGASNRGIDDIRQLREQVKFSPVLGSFRVYIIDEVHQITTDAFNALLKTLEEPPSHAKFIFATTSPQKVPPTILSRCQRFDFRRLPSATVVEQLRRIAKLEAIQVEDGGLFAVARASEGSLRDAEVVFEQLASFASGPITESDVHQLLGSLEEDALVEWTTALVDHNAHEALAVFARQLERGRDVAQLLLALIGHVRNVLIARTVHDAPGRRELVSRLVDVPPELLPKLEEQAARLPAEEWLLIAQIFSHAYEWIRRSPFSQAIVEFALIRVATRESWASLDELSQRLDALASGAPTAHVAASSTMASTAPVAPSRPATPAPAPKPAVAKLAPTPPPAKPAAPKSSLRAESPIRIDDPEAIAVSQVMASAVATLMTIEEISAKWPEVLDRVGRQKMSVASCLFDAKPLSITADEISIGLPGFSLHQDVLNTTENIRFIEQALEEIVARRMRITYTTLPEGVTASPVMPGRSPAPSDIIAAPLPPLVNDIVSLFDATVVRQPTPQP